MADVVHVDLVGLKAGDAGVMMPEFVDREGRHVRQAGDQRRQEHFGVTPLTIQRRHVFLQVLFRQLRRVLAQHVLHHLDFLQSTLHLVHGVGVAFDLKLLSTGQTCDAAGFVMGDELQHFALKLITDELVGFRRHRLEQLSQGDLRRTERIVGLLRAAGREALRDAVETAARIAAVQREASEFDMLHRRREQFGQFEIDRGPTNRTDALVGLEHA